MNSTPKAVILTAPQAWGKTTDAVRLQAEYGCSTVVDDWDPSQPITPGALHLTNIAPQDLPSIRKADIVARGWS